MRDVSVQGNYDVAVVGGGAAGLSAAVVLGRCRRSVLLVDAGRPRNSPAAHAQGFLTRDGVLPGELLARGREETRPYPVDLVAGLVTGLRRAGDGFLLELDGGQRTAARQVLVCTGLVDQLPDIPGLRDRWGRDVVHCPFCHGWEARGEPTVILVDTPLDLHKAVLATALTDRLVLVTGGPDGLDVAAEPDGELLARAGVPVVTGPAAELVVDGDRLVALRTADGREVPASVVYCTPPVTPADDLLTELGAASTTSVFGPLVEVDTHGATSVPGLWAAGNAVDPTAQLVHAAADGYRAAQAIAGNLAVDDLRRRAAIG